MANWYWNPHMSICLFLNQQKNIYATLCLSSPTWPLSIQGFSVTVCVCLWSGAFWQAVGMVACSPSCFYFQYSTKGRYWHNTFLEFARKPLELPINMINDRWNNFSLFSFNDIQWLGASGSFLGATFAWYNPEFLTLGSFLSHCRIAVGLIFLFIIIFVIVDVVTVSEEPYNLVSASGILVYVLLFFIFSHNPARVSTSGKWTDLSVYSYLSRLTKMITR